MKRQKSPKQIQKYSERMLDLIMGSLIALCFLMVPVFPSLDTHKYSARFAIIAFSLAIPALIFSLLIAGVYRLSKNKKPPILRYVFMGTIGVLSSVAGLVSILWYIMPAAACVLFITGMFCFTTYYDYENTVVRELQEKKQSGKKQTPIIRKINHLKKTIFVKIHQVLLRHQEKL